MAIDVFSVIGSEFAVHGVIEITLDLSIISQFLESHISITPRTSDFMSYLRG